MVNDKVKEELFQKMIDSKFSIAEFLYIFEAIEDQLILDANLSAKQMAILPIIKSLFMVATDRVDENKMDLIVETLLVVAKAKSLDSLDVLRSIIFIMTQVMQVFGLINSKNYAELIKKEPDMFSREKLSIWLSDNLELVSGETLSEVIQDCDGSCDTCEVCKDKQEEKNDSNLH